MEKTPQLMFKNVNMDVPRYRYARIPLNNLPSGQVPLLPTSSTLCEWKIPAQSVINLSRSYIAYQYTLAAPAAGLYNVANIDGCDWRQVYFGMGSGVGVVDLQYADTWVNASRPLRTKFEDFLSNDQLSGFYPCNQLNTSNIYPFSLDGLAAGTANASSKSYIEPQHLEISINPAATQNVYRYFPLHSFKDTVLDMDKDMVFGTDTYLRLWTNYLQKIAFTTTTPANPNANITPIAASINMTNCYLYLAVEQDVAIQQSLLSSLARGSVRMSIPYTFPYRFSSSAAAVSANISLTLTKNYGRGIKAIRFIPYDGAEYTQYAYDHSNVNGTKVAQIQTTMDSRPNTDYILNCYNPLSSVQPTGVTVPTQQWADDYREAQKFLPKSCLNGYPMFQAQWSYADMWGVPCSDVDIDIPDENIDNYLDLLRAGDRIYAVQALTPATATHSGATSGLLNYIFVTFVRTMIVQSDGLILDV